ncbi:hypothetical protein SprV_0301272800 [Sparganum proliferum]
MRNHLYTTFVDLTKAFDTAHREGLRKIMQKFDCPERFLEHDRIVATSKAKREARKPQIPRSFNANGQPLPTCPRCQRTSRERNGLVGHLLTQCANNPKSTSPTLAPAANATPIATSVTADHIVVVPPSSTADTVRPPPTPASTTTTTTTITTTMTSSTPPNDGTTPNVPSPSTITTNTPTSSDVGSIHTCPRCDRTSTSHVSLVDRLEIHRTEAGESVYRALAYIHYIHLNCHHCLRIFGHLMDLLGHMRIHGSLR